MANTAINHDPVATFPGSSTNTAVVKWSGTSGNALLDSGVIIDGSNNVTGLNNVTATGYLHLTGDEKELRFYEGANYIAIAAPSGLGADYTFTLPLNDGAADEFLQTNGSGVLVWAVPGAIANDSIVEAKLNVSNGPTNGQVLTARSGVAGGFTWEAASAGAALTGSTNNTVVTVTGADAMQGEADLTYDGAELKVSGNSTKLVLDQTSGDGYILELRSTDVEHNLSGYNTHTYGQFMKKHPTSGMLQIWGFSDGHANQAIGMSLAGISGIAANATKSTSAIGIIELNTGVVQAGGAIINPAANGNMVVIRDAASGNSKFIFDEDGDGHADSSWTTYSDSRLKFNQEVIPYGLDTLMQLQPKVYARDSGYLEDGVPVLEGKRNRQIGFIAQEVKALIPEVIKDIDDEATSWYSLDDGKLMAVVVKAIQELNDKVDALTE